MVCKWNWQIVSPLTKLCQIERARLEDNESNCLEAFINHFFPDLPQGFHFVIPENILLVHFAASKKKSLALHFFIL